MTIARSRDTKKKERETIEMDCAEKKGKANSWRKRRQEKPSSVRENGDKN